jgi:hypothetical protein
MCQEKARKGSRGKKLVSRLVWKAETPELELTSAALYSTMTNSVGGQKMLT